MTANGSKSGKEGECSKTEGRYGRSGVKNFGKLILNGQGINRISNKNFLKAVLSVYFHFNSVSSNCIRFICECIVYFQSTFRLLSTFLAETLINNVVWYL